MAAKEVGRPVRLVLDRAQMYTSVSYREEQWIDLRLGATRDFTFMYDLPALETRCRLKRANVMAPTFMRGSGETPGMLVQECAMNELAAELGIDPIELRLRNHADTPNRSTAANGRASG